MTDIKTYLFEKYKEDMPGWLAEYRSGDSFQREAFFASRLVYYPGYMDDGQPVKLFGGAHAAHVFVYADYGVTRDQLIERLQTDETRFRGYTTFDRVDLNESDIVPAGWRPTLSESRLGSSHTSMREGAPYGFLEVLTRDSRHDEGHGPPRLAILFLGADGVATYDALFCQKESRSVPFAMLLQGQRGLLHELASKAGVLPHLMLAENNDAVWDEYELVEGVDWDVGGMHANRRYLCQRKNREP